MFKYFTGKNPASKTLTADHATTFKEWVHSKIKNPFILALTYFQFWTLDKAAQSKAKQAPYVVACTFPSTPWEGRKLEHACPCGLVILDIDDSEHARPFVENPRLSSKRLNGLNYVVYRTISSKHDKPRLRVMVEAADIPPDRYPEAVQTIGGLLGLPYITRESAIVTQAMFLPTVFNDYVSGIDDDPLVAEHYDGNPFTVEDISTDTESLPPLSSGNKPAPARSTGDTIDDFLTFSESTVEGVTLDDARTALEFIEPDCSRPRWLEIAAALKHQFGATQDDEGRELFDRWSAKGSKYEGQKDTATVWRSFKEQAVGRKPVTIRSLLKRAVEGGWDGLLESGVRWLPKGGSATAATLVQPVPLSTSLAPVKPFDPAWLPAPFHRWVADIAERMQCPPEFPAIAAMVALSSVAGRRFCIQPKRLDEAYTEFCHLWGMLVGNPSLMKSPAMRAAMRLLRAMESEAFQAFDDLERERKAAEIAAKIKRSALESEAKKAAKKGDSFDYASLIEEDGASAPCRRYIVNDASIEALGEVLRDNLTGTLLYQDELAGLLAMLEKDGNQSLRAFLLQAWSGNEGFTFDRIIRGTRRIEACALSVLGSIQPGVIAQHVRGANGGGEGADGFMQRFSLMVWPDINPNWKNIDRPLDRQAEENAAAVFRAIENITPEALLEMGAKPGRDDIPTFQFAEDAQERFDVWREELELRLRSGTMAPAFEAHLGKYRKLVPALAVLIHVAEGQPGSVALSALERALSFADCLESHAARLYGSSVMAEFQAAKVLLHKLRDTSAGLPDKFTAREVRRKGWAGLTRSEDVDAACDLLVDHHWLIATPQPTTGNGGRPTQLYTLSPLAKK